MTDTDLSQNTGRADVTHFPCPAESSDRPDGAYRHRNGRQTQKYRHQSRYQERQFQLCQCDPHRRTERRSGSLRIRNHRMFVENPVHQIISRKHGKIKPKHEKGNRIGDGSDVHFIAGQCTDSTDTRNKINRAKHDRSHTHAVTPLSGSRHTPARPPRGGMTGYVVQTPARR